MLSAPALSSSSRQRRRTASLLNVGIETESAGASMVMIAWVDRSSDRANACRWSATGVWTPPGMRRMSVVGRDARARGQAVTWRALGRCDFDLDVRESRALERVAQRRRRKMVDVHQIVGHRRAIAALETGAPRLLQQLRRPARHLHRDPAVAARSPAGSSSSRRTGSGMCSSTSVSVTASYCLAEFEHLFGFEPMHGRTGPLCRVRGRPRVDLRAFRVPARLPRKVQEAPGMRSDVEERARLPVGTRSLSADSMRSKMRSL